MNKVPYSNLADLVDAILEMDLHSLEYPYLLSLVRTYNYWQDNPPEGVVGVGAITYAEQKLWEVQLDIPDSDKEV